MKYFSVPADFKKDTIDHYVNINSVQSDSCVFETYGQLTLGNFIGSGRAYDLIPEVDYDLLKDYVSYSQKNKIQFNYTLNTLCMSNLEFTREGIASIVDFLGNLYTAGVRSITVALPSLIDIIRKSKWNFEIKASTICQITNVNRAMAYKKLGVDRIVLDESINRDFSTLKDICSAFGRNVEVITNVICHKDCIYEVFHHNQTSHDIGNQSSNPSIQYYSHRCMLQRCNQASTLLKLAWIRPEDLHYYTDIGIHTFKLQGRQAVMNGDVVKTVTHYINESFSGNLMDLLDMFSPTNSFSANIENRLLDHFIEPFVHNTVRCRNNCDRCHYCDSYADQNLPVDKINEMCEIATTFYLNYDGFHNAVNEAIDDCDTRSTDSISDSILAIE